VHTLGAQNVNVCLTAALLEKLKWDVLDNPLYSPDLTPSDFHLFLHLKKHLTGKKFDDDDDDDDQVQEEVMMWLKGQGLGDTEAGSKKTVRS
jgi:hypothetical protein